MSIHSDNYWLQRIYEILEQEYGYSSESASPSSSQSASYSPSVSPSSSPSSSAS